MKLSAKILKEMIKEEYIKLLKEENETLKAQDACKGAIFQVKKMVEDLLSELKKSGLVENFKLRVKPYNNGYELVTDTLEENIDMMFSLSDLKDATTGDIINFVWNKINLHLQPDTWFEKNLADGSGSKIEGRALSYKPKKGSFGNYIRYEVKSKADISKVAKEFVKTNKDIINAIKSDLKKSKIGK